MYDTVYWVDLIIYEKRDFPFRTLFEQIWKWPHIYSNAISRFNARRLILPRTIVTRDILLMGRCWLDYFRRHTQAFPAITENLSFQDIISIW